MNKKAVGPIGAIFLFLVFIIIWFMWMGGWINTMCQQVIIDNGYTGVEAFFYSNFNFILFIIILLGIMGFIYFGGGA